MFGFFSALGHQKIFIKESQYKISYRRTQHSSGILLAVSNDDLARIIQIGDSAIADSIASLIGFFLSTEISVSGETRYILNTVTSQYVKEKNRHLKLGAKISERVKAFKAGAQKKSNPNYS